MKVDTVDESVKQFKSKVLIKIAVSKRIQEYKAAQVHGLNQRIDGVSRD